MAKSKWIFLSNTFEVQTRGSFRKMLSLATDTDSKLHAEIADPLIAGIYNDYHPVFAAYPPMYATYHSMESIHHGNTLNVETLLEHTLANEIRKWESAVRSIYREDTPNEVEIFPNKRTPFFHGSYATRISRVSSLAEKLNSEPLLSATALQVASFYNLLLTARDLQLQKEGLKAKFSALLENQRVLVAEALWGIVLGRLMDKYRKNPTAIAHFFDSTLLRKKRKETKTEQLVKELMSE